MSDEEYTEVLRNVLVSQPCLSGAPGQPALLTTGLYIGGQRNAESYPTLERLGITHVVNCAGYKGHRTYHGSPYEGLGIKYLEFLADDTDHYDITQHFKEAFSFIDRARKSGGVVLVHCALGINRSGATCVGYLMLMCRTNLIKTAILIKSKRRVLLTNIGFQKRLVRLARKNGSLDDLDSSYLQRFVTSKPRHRSSSISLHQSNDHLFPNTTRFTAARDFSFPFYSSNFTPSHLQTSSSSSSSSSHYNQYPEYNPLPSLFKADEILGREYGLNSLPRSSPQSRIISLTRNSVCFI